MAQCNTQSGINNPICVDSNFWCSNLANGVYVELQCSIAGSRRLDQLCPRYSSVRISFATVSLVV